MIKKYSFPMMIALISTAIFCFSPGLSESARPKSPLIQHFVEAKVTRMESQEVAPDPHVPSMMTGRQIFLAEILEGAEKGKEVRISNPLSRQHNVYVQEGDHFIMMVRVKKNGQSYYWAFNHKRSPAIYTMLAVFLLLLLSFGKKEGLNSVISLYFTAALVVGVLIPAIFAGWNPMLLTIILMGIKIVVNYILVCGYNHKSVCAMIGTLLGVIAAGAFSQVFGEMAHLSGIYLDKGEDIVYLTTAHPIQIRWLMFTAIMISALGAVMDVAISISSSYHELSQADPNLTPAQLRKASMNIGRDIMGTMTNTLILAIAGSSLTTMMMVWGFDMPVIQFLNTPLVTMAVVHALAGSIGIVLTIPLTAWACSVFFPVKVRAEESC
ncbi:YibE/F-like protein [Vibrio aerogenes CECT 7868]|uniref:YibE/F-like protein n=1 Tax=Vibrio aerogenes CECT 7868 TaxID=1216006 RepID=A0A1M5VGH5_9VIBR|nr:YibE/F family protein [Vibrio aerogenes]SHH74204.1 YibE/F-like protein [Vibrio aerogenes CECT 7868]